MPIRNLGTAANVAVIGLVLFAVFGPQGPVGRDIVRWRAERAQRQYLSTNWQNVSRGPRLDTSQGPVVLVEFADYECPFCQRQHAQFNRWLDGLGVGVVYRHYPLASHPSATGAALAAICAEKQGRFREMHDRLFSTVAWQADTNWTREALAAGVPDTGEFAHCLTGSDARERLDSDRAMARELGIVATPTFIYRTGMYDGVIAESTLTRITQARND